MLRWFQQKLIGDERLEEAAQTWSEASPGAEGITPEEVFYTAASRFLDVQVSTNDVFDSRSTAAFATGLTVLPVTFGLLRLSSVEIPRLTLALLAISLLMFVMLLFCVWRASRLRVLEFRPDMRTLEDNSTLAPGETLRRWVASEYLASTEINTPLLERKGIWVGRAVTALYAEGLFLSAAAIATLF